MDAYAQKNPHFSGFSGVLWTRVDVLGLVHGAGNRNRTYDLIITNDALYQLSYSGEKRNSRGPRGVAQEGGARDSALMP